MFINPSMEGMVKIGRTEKSPEVRADQLSKATAVPTPFLVVYDELVADFHEVERRLHERFAGYRVKPNREFFRIPIKVAVKALQEEAAAFLVAESEFSRVEILRVLLQRYPHYLRPDLVAVAIVQEDDVCFLETTRSTQGDLRDSLVQRIDLSFIGDPGDPVFSPSNAIEINADRFAQLDPVSLINCTDLFTIEAAHYVDRVWRSTGTFPTDPPPAPAPGPAEPQT